MDISSGLWGFRSALNMLAPKCNANAAVRNGTCNDEVVIATSSAKVTVWYGRAHSNW